MNHIFNTVNDLSTPSILDPDPLIPKPETQTLEALSL